LSGIPDSYDLCKYKLETYINNIFIPAMEILWQSVLDHELDNLLIVVSIALMHMLLPFKLHQNISQSLLW